MTAIPPSFTAPPGHARPRLAPRPSDTTGTRWAALAEVADLIAALAGLDPERAPREARNLPALVRDAEPWRRERAEQGVDDLTAVMEPGIAALLAISARGADPRPAALALWREFVAARGAILSLLPPPSSDGV